MVLAICFAEAIEIGADCDRRLKGSEFALELVGFKFCKSGFSAFMSKPFWVNIL